MKRRISIFVFLMVALFCMEGFAQEQVVKEGKAVKEGKGASEEVKKGKGGSQVEGIFKALKGNDYVGVVNFNVESLVKRPIFNEAYALAENELGDVGGALRSSGIDLKSDFKRVYLVLPTEVEKRHFLLIAEMNKDIKDGLKELLGSEKYESREFKDVQYYAEKHKNIAFVSMDKMLIVGTELQVKAYLSGLKEAPEGGMSANKSLWSKYQSSQKSKDISGAFALDSRLREKLKKQDPLVDLTSTDAEGNKTGGIIKGADLRSGHFNLHFASGMEILFNLTMESKESASLAVEALKSLISMWRSSGEVKAFGLESLLKGIEASASGSDVVLKLKMSQSELDKLKNSAMKVNGSSENNKANAIPESKKK